MRTYAIGENISQMSEFRDVFGMRYVGLVDSSGVYEAYRVPNPQAPYPQDYVIDQQGVVRYWSDQFDPQEVMRAIDRLLGSGVEAGGGRQVASSGLAVSPNPFHLRTTISRRFTTDGPGGIAVFDATGRLVRTLSDERSPRLSSLSWDGTDESGRQLPAGVYYVRSREARALPVLLLR